jgi:hypothetical protein
VLSNLSLHTRRNREEMPDLLAEAHDEKRESYALFGRKPFD